MSKLNILLIGFLLGTALAASYSYYVSREVALNYCPIHEPGK